MKDNRIERAEVFVVAPDVERYTWAEGMTGQCMVNVILRLTAASGLQGIAGAAMITSLISTVPAKGRCTPLPE
jgi:hypothetical protein